MKNNGGCEVLEINDIYLMDNLKGMKMMDDCSVDAVITSPPYDNLRTYNNSCEWNFDIFKEVAKEIFRVVKIGGVVVWVVADATIDGSETGTSFKQALYFKEIGFNIHDTMIWDKNNFIPLTHNRYEQEFEYMFVFSKGTPKTFNPILVDCATAGGVHNRSVCAKVKEQAVRSRMEKTVVKDKKCSGNVWRYSVGVSNGYDTEHPAIFPINLVGDHLKSWTNAGDLVMDPFGGSGTTAAACISMGRNFILFEKEVVYFNETKKLLDKLKGQRQLFRMESMYGKVGKSL